MPGPAGGARNESSHVQQAQCAAFTGQAEQRDALRSLETVMRADGIDAKENALLEEIKALFP